MGKEGYRHIGIEQRRVIEAALNERDSLAEIARRIGFEVSSVRREILRNRRDDGLSTSRNKEKNNCAYLRTCKVRSLCNDGCEKRLCRACHLPCQQMCDSFRPRICKTIERAPFVCNACGRYATCSLGRFKYSAESADALAKRRSKESREGVDLTKEEMAILVETVREGLLKGQSVHHIIREQRASRMRAYLLPLCGR